MSTLPLKSILCVEDNKDARELMLAMLAGYRIVFAANGYEAIREFHNGVFDAYILDQWLPDWSGVQLCREIRKTDPRGAIFFCTGAARKDDRLRAMRAGADVYLTKPIDPEQLLRQLRVHLEMGEIESLRAKVDEEAAIQLELERRIAAAAQRVSVARESAERAIERTARTKAFLAFVGSGGTRANFERWWPQVYGAAWAHCDYPAKPAAARREV